jgi:hypothetical protein
MYWKHFLTSADHVLAPIFELNVGRDIVLLLFMQLKNRFNWCVALSPRCIRAIVLLAILYVQIGDPIMVCLDVTDRIEASREKSGQCRD